MSKKKLSLCYLVFLWFLIPWFVLATYSGEISDYYFSTNRVIALIIIAFLLTKIFYLQSWLPKVIILIFLAYYAMFNINKFFCQKPYNGLDTYRQNVIAAIKEGRKIDFQEGSPESYLYYVYTRNKKIERK